ncbi:MAG: OmpH family outer membrane protein [Saprospiraceae bacterium]
MKKTLLFSLLSLFCIVAQAQKFGFLNSALLLEELPEVKAANTSLQTFQEMKQKQGRAKVEALQMKYQDLQKKEKAGELSPKQLSEQADVLKKEEEEIGKLEQQIAQELQEKKQTTLQPILDKVNKAISEVAKEQGLTYVFDSTAGSLLYADEKLDVSAAVKAKLGITPAATDGK